MSTIVIKLNLENATKRFCKDCDGQNTGGAACPFPDMGWSERYQSFIRHPDCVKLEKFTKRLLKNKENNDNIPDPV